MRKLAWIVSATPQITKVHTGSGGTIDPSLLSDPWDEEVSFDDIDFDESVQSVMSGGDFVLKNGKNSEPEEERPGAHHPDLYLMLKSLRRIWN